MYDYYFPSVIFEVLWYKILIVHCIDKKRQRIMCPKEIQGFFPYYPVILMDLLNMLYIFRIILQEALEDNTEFPHTWQPASATINILR